MLPDPGLGVITYPVVYSNTVLLINGGQYQGVFFLITVLLLKQGYMHIAIMANTRHDP